MSALLLRSPEPDNLDNTLPGYVPPRVKHFIADYLNYV